MIENGSNESIAITGIGIISPLGKDWEHTWRALLNGEVAIKKHTDWIVDDTPVDKEIMFGKCAAFDFIEMFPEVKAPFPLKYSQMAMTACAMAIKDAGIVIDGDTANKIGLIVNSDLGTGMVAEKYVLRLLEKGPALVSPFDFTKSVSNCVIGNVARAFGITGASSFIIGENSVSYGIDLIRQGKSDIVICGGFDEVRDRLVLSYFDHGMIEDDLEPITNETIHSRTILGEGSCFIILENMQHAKIRSAKIYCEIIEELSSSDLDSNELIQNRNADYLIENLRRLLSKSGYNESDIEFCIGDACLVDNVVNYDCKGFSDILKSGQMYSNFKTRTGEMFSASSLFSLACGALSLSEGILPAFKTHDSSVKEISFSVKPVKENSTITATAAAIVNTFQLGGNITSFLIKKSAT